MYQALGIYNTALGTERSTTIQPCPCLPFAKLLALGYANGLFNDNSMTIEVDKQSRQPEKRLVKSFCEAALKCKKYDNGQAPVAVFSQLSVRQTSNYPLKTTTSQPRVSF